MDSVDSAPQIIALHSLCFVKAQTPASTPKRHPHFTPKCQVKPALPWADTWCHQKFISHSSW